MFIYSLRYTQRPWQDWKVDQQVHRDRNNDFFIESVINWLHASQNELKKRKKNMRKKQKKHRMNEMYCWKKHICADFNLWNGRFSHQTLERVLLIVILTEPIEFGGPGSFVCIVEHILEVLQSLFVIFLHGQGLTQVADVIDALEFGDAGG